MNATGQDQAVMNTATQENEPAVFKISPPKDGSTDWILSSLSSDSGETSGENEFRVFACGNEQKLAEQQKRIAGLPAKGASFELKRKAELLVFLGKEVILQCPAAERESRLAMLKDFCRIYSRIEELENKATVLMKEAKKDAVFVGRVSEKLLPQFDRLGEKKQSALLMRIDFAEIKRELLRTDWKGHDGKLFGELIEASGIEDRIEQLDEEIEVSEDVYGEAVERLSDFDYFWREYWAEIWIIVILIVELAEFFLDIYMQLVKH